MASMGPPPSRQPAGSAQFRRDGTSRVNFAAMDEAEALLAATKMAEEAREKQNPYVPAGGFGISNSSSSSNNRAAPAAGGGGGGASPGFDGGGGGGGDVSMPHGLILSQASLADSLGCYVSGAYLTIQASKRLAEFKMAADRSTSLLQRYKIRDEEDKRTVVKWTIISGTASKATGKAATMALNITKRTIGLKIAATLKEELMRDCLTKGGAYVPSERATTCEFGGEDETDDGDLMGFMLLRHTQQFFAKTPRDFAPEAMLCNADLIKPGATLHSEYLDEDFYYTEGPNGEKMPKTIDDDAALVGKRNLLLITDAAIEEAIQQQKANIATLMERLELSRTNFIFGGHLRRIDASEPRKDVHAKRAEEEAMNTIIRQLTKKSEKQAEGAPPPPPPPTLSDNECRQVLTGLGNFINKVCAGKHIKKPRHERFLQGKMGLNKKDGIMNRRFFRDRHHLGRPDPAKEIAGSNDDTLRDTCALLVALGLGSWERPSSERGFSFAPEMRAGHSKHADKERQFNTLVRVLKTTKGVKKSRAGAFLPCLKKSATYVMGDFALAVLPPNIVRPPWGSAKKKPKSSSKKKKKQKKRKSSGGGTPGRHKRAAASASGGGASAMHDGM